MIEASELLPLNCRMAGLASRDSAVSPLCCHLFAELTGVRIVMTGRAGTILKPIFHGSDRAARLLQVALRAGHGDMRAGQRETRLLVFGQGEHRRTPTFIFQVVTFLTAI